MRLKMRLDEKYHVKTLNTGEIEMQLKGKKMIVIGERDGIQGPAIAECLKYCGVELLFVQTQCFV